MRSKLKFFLVRTRRSKLIKPSELEFRANFKTVIENQIFGINQSNNIGVAVQF
jgi:hypothetical protein